MKDAAESGPSVAGGADRSVLVSTAFGRNDFARRGTHLQIRAKLYVFRMHLKSAWFAGSVNEPIEVTIKVVGGRS